MNDKPCRLALILGGILIAIGTLGAGTVLAQQDGSGRRAPAASAQDRPGATPGAARGEPDRHGATGLAPATFRRPGQKPLLYVDSLGGLHQWQTPNLARVHLYGGVAVSNGDYLRGIVEVPEGTEDVTVIPGVRAIFELAPDAGAGPLRALTLTLGSGNALSDFDLPEGEELEPWYEADEFAGLAARFSGGWFLGATYTIFTAPNDVAPTTQQVTLAGAFAGPNLIGSLNPQVNLSVRVDEAPGAFALLRIIPIFKFNEGASWPVAVSLPTSVGIGFDDFYGRGTGAAAYADVGVIGTVPLKFIPEDFGNWALSAGVEFLVRQDDLKQPGGRFEDEDNFITLAGVSLRFIY